MRRLTLALAIAVAAAGASWAGAAGGTGERPGELRLVKVAGGFDRAVFVTTPRNELNRLYVVEQSGVVRVLDGGRLRARPFLDIRSRVESGGNEQGLLGLAFDPAYAKNHRFYVNYTGKPNGDTYVVSYRSEGSRAIPSTRKLLIHVGQPYSNHNGGMVAFGRDGKLYVGMGDGGSGGDPENRAQNPRSLLGKLLRLDPAGKSAPALAALGLRNPWRFSFDRRTSDLYIGDVGQNAVEEVDYLPAATKELVNFGWRVYEGSTVFEQGALGPGRLTKPVAEYSHDDGCTVVGGYVYRGKTVKSALGRYFYGDYCSGTVWSLAIAGGRATAVRREPFEVEELSSFGEDARGELYLVSLAGDIFRLAG
jgi:glucose/arabinose dehydrogenase